VLLVAFLGFSWLLGESASVLGVSQFAVTLMIPAIAWAAFGTRLLRALAFPFLFLMFAVPFGEIFIPSMINWTADFTILALQLSGVPVYREGNNFIIPSGMWSVVQACSGIRYLIASVVAGVLYAFLTYRSTKRRVIFIAASFAIPIIANWLRAYMIVMLAHLSDNRIATGVDHLIYGWVFFGIVMLPLFWFGAHWREDDPPARARGSTGPVAIAPRPSNAVIAALALALGAGLAWALAPRALDAGDAHALRLAPVEARNGWEAVSGRGIRWTPKYSGWRDIRNDQFAKGGTPVGVFVGYYASQDQGNELITSINSLVEFEDKAPVFLEVSRGTHVARAGDDPLHVRTSLLTGSRRGNMLVWHWYWVDGQWTTSPYVAKALLARSNLLGRGDDSAVVVVYTPTDGVGDGAQRTLEAFVTDMLPSIEGTIASARAPRQ
jgi:exosortase A